MQIGIISDTHNHHRNVCRAIEVFNEQGVECVLHAGDIVSPSTAELFAGLRHGRLIAVFGNCDADRVSLGSAIEAIGGEVHRGCYQGRIDGRTIHMTHEPDAVGRTCDLVIHGHTHRRDIHQAAKTLVINPGAATNWMGQPGQIVILDTADMTTTVRSLDP